MTNAKPAVFELIGDIDDDTMPLVHKLRVWGRGKKNEGRPLTLYISSDGGELRAGIALYDTLRALVDHGHHLTTVVHGYACSMAGLIFLAGDVRVIGPHSIFHIHEPSGMTGGTVTEVEDWTASFRAESEMLMGIYLDRTLLTRKVINKRTVRKDWYMGAEEAVKYGIDTNIG